MPRILDGMTEVPAFVQNGRLDVLAANPLGRALYAPVFADPARPANLARFNFLNPRARDFWGDWERAADDTVAMLRTEAGRDPYDKALTDLVGELSTRSDEFRVRWAAHDVRLHRTGLKHIHHPVVGDLHLSYEVMDLPADPGLALVAFSADAGSPADDALRLLASWAATQAQGPTHPGQAPRVIADSPGRYPRLAAGAGGASRMILALPVPLLVRILCTSVCIGGSGHGTSERVPAGRPGTSREGGADPGLGGVPAGAARRGGGGGVRARRWATRLRAPTAKVRRRGSGGPARRRPSRC